MSSLGLKLVFAAVICGALLTLIHHFREDGADSVRRATEKQNNEAADNADKGSLDYDACRDAGRMFDFRTRRCGGPAPRRGE